jgi:tetratricopeptide (TPR) repeat protein
MKSILMRITLISILFVLFIPNLTFAEQKTFIKEYTYQASDFDSRHSSRTLSLKTVKRLLLEELGTYLISETEVKNMQLTKDQVTAYSAGIVSAEVMDEKWDGKTFWLKAKVSADPKEVEEALKKITENKYKTQELEGIRKMAQELSTEIERLKEELAATTKLKKRDSKAVAKKVKEYEKTIRGLDANEWLEKGLDHAYKERWMEAIDAFTRVMKLNPDLAAAYTDRGYVYAHLGNYQKAINDHTKAIELKPDLALAYYNRAIVRDKSGNYQHAIKDFNRAIDINPDDADVYMMRGNIYGKLGNYHQAIKDQSRAIELKPDLAAAYYNRGVSSLVGLGDEEQGIKDLIIAARLGFKKAQDVLTENGVKW